MLTPQYRREPGFQARPGEDLPSAREVVMFIYGWCRGDEAKVRAILDGFRAITGNGSLRAVAARHSFPESNLRMWIKECRSGVAAASGRVAALCDPSL